MNTPFPPPFRTMLATILRDAPRIRGARDLEARANRRSLGEGGTFARHRAYSEGDDLRYLDWNVYARTGDLFLKQLEVEDHRTLNLIVDSSGSMDAGPRRTGALRLAAILGGLALVRLDGLRLYGEGRLHVLQGAVSVNRLLDLLASLRLDDAAPIDIASVPLRTRCAGRFAWISDFAEPDAFAPALRLLRLHGRRVTGWLPSLVDDRLPPSTGIDRLRDPETGF